MDFENALNLEQMTDEDLRDLVRQELEEDNAYDADRVDVLAEDGTITVEGRVGTEAERQRVSQVLAGLGAVDVVNDVVVDEVTRGQRDEAADEAHAEDEEAGARIGESGDTTTDTAEHLHRDGADRLYGTRDMKESIEEGIPYTPPDGPIQEGVEGEENH